MTDSELDLDRLGIALLTLLGSVPDDEEEDPGVVLVQMLVVAIAREYAVAAARPLRVIDDVRRHPAH